MELAAGTVLLGKYRVDEVIGIGGMGRVVRASHLYLQQSVAIKILLPQMVESTSTVARFLREAQSMVRLKSEHIVRVQDVGTMPDGAPFMVMEYLEGNDLNQILRHHGPQTPAIVCDLMLQACEGIAEAHSIGIIHRDIKPSNFFITRRPDGSMLLKILDFGISKSPVGYDELTGTQTVIGTPSYMAPEQMRSGKYADARSDLWSIGIVMYQLLSGQLPFSGEGFAALVLQVASEPPAPLRVPLPNGLGEVLLRCLEKDPKFRHQNVGELARMLAPFATDPIAAAQAAGRATRILSNVHQRNSGPQIGQQGLPLSAGGGLATPVPISPAQLTPRSWPPSTSQSHGKGQLTHKVGGSRGWVIAGAASVVVLAAAGGYIANQMMRDKPAAAARSEEVQAPPTAAAAEPPTSGVATPPPAGTTAPPTAGTTLPPASPATPPPAAMPPPTTALPLPTPTIATAPTTPTTPTTKTTKTTPTTKTTKTTKTTATTKTDAQNGKADVKVTNTDATKADTAKTAPPKAETTKTDTTKTEVTKTTTTKADVKTTKANATTATKPDTKPTKTKTEPVKTETKPTKIETKPKPKKDDLFDSRH